MPLHYQLSLLPNVLFPLFLFLCKEVISFLHLITHSTGITLIYLFISMVMYIFLLSILPTFRIIHFLHVGFQWKVLNHNLNLWITFTDLHWSSLWHVPILGRSLLKQSSHLCANAFSSTRCFIFYLIIKKKIAHTCQNWDIPVISLNICVHVLCV